MDSNQTKTIADFLITDLESEMQTTLRVLNAVPNDGLAYQPDSKSKTGLGLVRHSPGRRVAAEQHRRRRVRASARRFRCLRDYELCRRRGPLQSKSSGRSGSRTRPVGGATQQRNRLVRNGSGARGQLFGDDDQAFGSPPRPAQLLPARDGWQRPRYLRAIRRYAGGGRGLRLTLTSNADRSARWRSAITTPRYALCACVRSEVFRPPGCRQMANPSTA